MAPTDYACWSWPRGTAGTKLNQPRARRPTGRDLLRVGLWGGLTAGVAYGLARGSLPVAVLLMVIFGVAQRLVAVRIVRARGGTPPPWWWT